MLKGTHMSKEARNKISLFQIGKKRSEETKKKISNTKKRLFAEGKLFTEEHKRNISLSKIGHITSEETKIKIRSYRHTNQEKRKMSIALKGRKSPNLGKKFPMELYPNWGVRGLILPLKDSVIEKKIQGFLKQLEIGFFTHQYPDIKHNYKCDIFIPVQRNKDRFIRQPIIIECDGDFTHCNPSKYDKDFICYPSNKKITKAQDRWERDKIRTQELENKGIRVIRLWEHDIKVMNLEQFKEIIKDKIEVYN